jgi:hypothetical protein
MALTFKQRRFCRLVAAGTPQTVAYEQTYDSRGGKRRTRQVQANQLAHKPHVAAQIQAYEEQFAPIADYRRVKQEMFSNLYRLATESPDDKIRLSACKLVHEICVHHEEREGATLKTVKVDALINEIAELTPRRTLELETADETAEDNAADTTGTESE